MGFKTVKVWEELALLDPKDVSKRSLATYNFKEKSYVLKVIDQEYYLRLNKCVVEKNVDGNMEKAP